MKKLTFLELARTVLAEARTPMTAEEIWQFAQEKGHDDRVSSEGKTPWRTIGAVIYVDMRDNANSAFVKIDSKPRRFFVKGLLSESELTSVVEQKEESVDEPRESKYRERDLHPFLAYYAHTYMNTYVKTIRHEVSRRGKYAQWLHPDLVGACFPIGDWAPEVRAFGMTLGSELAKLYSFELKKDLAFSNIRESFFQAVSNSSWANEGYLVAARIEADDEFLSELKRLSSSFGLGIVRLDIRDPDSSEVLFPARFSPQLDWDTMNKLAAENLDFRSFLARIKNDLQVEEVRKEEYDRVYDVEELVGLISER